MRLAIAIVVAWIGVAHAGGDFFSSSPGPLSHSHANLDDAQHCTDCHVGNSKDLANDRCTAKACHPSIDNGKGFHSSAKVKGKKCETCHLEHKGKTADIMGWKSVGGEKTFDHDLTGWPRKGKHESVECTDCHKKKDKQGLRVYMGTDTLCGAAGCHAKDQPHKFVRKDMLKCERCHTESVWKPQKQRMEFDHNDRKDAAMPLLGSHDGIACTKCHAKAAFKLPFAKPTSCGNTGCHQSPHKDHLFDLRDCEWCHSPTFKSLKNTQIFDHTERTRFDLGPAHKRIKCYDCHTKAIGQARPTGACETCHQKDSHHGDRFKEFGSPPKCATCHPSGGPKFTPNHFNHTANTKFKLDNKHAQIACRQCHRGSNPSDFEDFRGIVVEKNGKIACMSCHAHAKVHADDDHPKGKWKNNECLTCHCDAGSLCIKKNNKIEDLAHNPRSGTFPLTGGHDPKKVPCTDCHTGRNAKGKTSFSDLKPNCDAAKQCHEDSLHQGSLGDNCLGCHKPGESNFSALRFDHDKPFPKDAKGEVTEYPLKGEHKKNKCEDCHTKERKFADTHATCSAEGCHKDDDAHKGRLGDKCEQCHVETGDNTFNHNTMSQFHLDGKHLQVRCADCHPSITFKPRPTNCFGCHPEPKVHRGQYGTACEQCHTTRTFEDVKPLHDVGDFSLKGMHDNIACERCHKDNRPLAGAGNLCLNCHRQDDVHQNSLSPRCGECHTQWSFAPARFDHSRVGCNLTGLHRTIACFDCHRNGNFSALSAECDSCHRQDALRAQAQNSPGGPGGTNHTAVTNCGQCHSPNFWNPLGNSGARFSVCR